MRLDRTWLMVAGLCCILCPSLGMLAASYYNRSGPALSVLPLTERELRLPVGERDAADGAALTFGLKWRVEGMAHTDFAARLPSSVPVKWMTADKRAELGIRPEDWRSDVSAFLVLEFNGPSYAQALKQACRGGESEACSRVRELESRLYVIDAGTDAGALRAQYPNADRYAIVRGVLKLSGTRDAADPALFIGGMDVDSVQAVEPLRSAKTSSGEMRWFDTLSGKPFEADIAFGHRDEPWNVSVVPGVHASAAPMQLPPAAHDGRLQIKPE